MYLTKNEPFLKNQRKKIFSPCIAGSRGAALSEAGALGTGLGCWALRCREPERREPGRWMPDLGCWALGAGCCASKATPLGAGCRRAGAPDATLSKAGALDTEPRMRGAGSWTSDAGCRVLRCRKPQRWMLGAGCRAAGHRAAESAAPIFDRPTFCNFNRKFYKFYKKPTL